MLYDELVQTEIIQRFVFDKNNDFLLDVAYKMSTTYLWLFTLLFKGVLFIFLLFFFASPIVCRSVHFINRRLKERANVATDSKHRNTRHVVVFSNEPNSFSRYRENSWNRFAVILECGKLAKWIFPMFYLQFTEISNNKLYDQSFLYIAFHEFGWICSNCKRKLFSNRFDHISNRKLH